MKNLCFIINSSGSLSVAFPLINSIYRQKNVNAILLFSKQLLKNKLLKKIKIKKIYIKENISLSQCTKTLNKYSPNMVFCGNNGNNNFEINFLRSCIYNNIKTFTVMDSWSYPLRRFQYKINNNNFYLFPNFIGVPNKKILSLIRKKNKTSKIFVAGFPQINYNIYKFLKYQKSQKINNFFEFLYISTPYEKPKKLSIKDGTEIFYNQKNIINDLINVLNNISRKFKIKIKLTLRTHPLETNSFISFINEKKKDKKNISILIDDKIFNYKSYLNKDAVLGISSMMLYEASLCGLPSISLQLDGEFKKPGKKNYFKNIRNIRVCFRKKDLFKEIKNILRKKKVKLKSSYNLEKMYKNKNIKIVKKILKELN
tara:strand:+ start:1678 stop:2787 length:1110 start_codon:yes stop_codon:yes gene_type:complete